MSEKKVRNAKYIKYKNIMMDIESTGDKKNSKDIRKSKIFSLCDWTNLFVHLRSIGFALALALLLVPIMSIAPVCGATSDVPAFVDVAYDYWARENITFAAEKKIVNGYYDAHSNIYTFAPENNVSYEEAVTMLYRALVASGVIAPDDMETVSGETNGQAGEETQQNSLVKKYESLLTANSIASWAEYYVADFLERGIVSEQELALFVRADGIGNPAPRMTVARWTAMALGKGFAGVYYLPYADEKSIAQSDRAYVDLLYRQGIMQGSLQLDGTVAFLPNSNVKRSEFAAIANRVYENVSAGYVLDNEIYSYSSADHLYMANELVLVLDGDTNTKKITNGTDSVQSYVSMGVPFVISGISDNSINSKAIGSDGKADKSGISSDMPQVHIASEPVRTIGIVQSIESDVTMGGVRYSKIGILIGDYEIFYILDSKAKNNATIKKGEKVEFIADGIKILEIK